MRRWTMTLIMLAAVSAFGCAGPGKLAEKSENKLAEGDVWKAWHLATKALDKAPANPRAREAAASAASAISQDWQRRITALADVDSMGAAEQVLSYVQFRTDAARYTTVAVGERWTGIESRLRQGAARSHYDDGAAAMNSARPKKAYAQFSEAARFVPDYRDVATRVEEALARARTRVAIVPLRSANRQMSHEVAAAWQGALTEQLAGGQSFTSILPTEDVERRMRAGDLGGTTRGEAIRLGEKTGADRVVWGAIGPIDSKSGVHFFTRNVWHRVSARDDAGRPVERWVEVAIPVVARTRTVTANLAYEVISTRGRATLARESGPRTLQARAVWTAYVPDGGSDSYVLVTDEFRRAHPDRAQQIETEWATVVGASTTLAQVLDAKRASARHSADRSEVLARYAAGAAFMMLEDLPSTEELAEAALSSAWSSVHRSLLALDPVDDVDAGAISSTE